MSGWSSIFNNTPTRCPGRGRPSRQPPGGRRPRACAINRPSDDPAGRFQVLQLQDESSRSRPLRATWGGVLDARNTADGVFQGLNNTLARVRTWQPGGQRHL